MHRSENMPVQGQGQGRSERPWLLPLLVAGVIAQLALLAAHLPPEDLPAIYFFTQDLPILCLAAAAALLVGRYALPEKMNRPLLLSARTIPALVAAAALLATGGSFLILLGYDMSRDESIATFTAQAVQRGTLMVPVYPGWERFAGALMPNFMHPVSSDQLWVPGYLPINGVIRGLFGAVAHPALANPALLAAGFGALFVSARRLWPHRPDAVAVAMLMALSSSQLLVNAMSAYAMTGHFALNAIWLALFVQRRTWAYAAAMVVAFAAMGLHQYHFHPLFAAPFMLWLVWRRDWGVAAFYLVGYCAAAYFWAVAYPELLAAAAGGAADGGAIAANGLMSRLQRLVAQSPALWAMNLVRFAAWQNLLLIPLCGLAWHFARSRSLGDESLVWPLLGVAGIGLVTMADQGHGYGYRYLNGAIPALCLLAGYGWQAMVQHPGSPSRWWGWLRGATALTVGIVLPAQLVMVHLFVAPHARLYAAIRSAPVDAVLIDPRGSFYLGDVVQNEAGPSEGPKLLSLGRVSPEALAALCGSDLRIALVDRRHARQFGIRPRQFPSQVDGDPAARAAQLQQAGCAPPLVL